jgi:hypothetical protein
MLLLRKIYAQLSLSFKGKLGISAQDYHGELLMSRFIFLLYGCISGRKMEPPGRPFHLHLCPADNAPQPFRACELVQQQ